MVVREASSWLSSSASNEQRCPSSLSAPLANLREELFCNYDSLGIPRKLEYTSTPYMTEKSTPADRRASERTPLRVSVKVRHQGSQHEGLTRDLSSSGIFLYAEPGMKPGSKLELVIMLPPGLGFGSGGWTFCEASVVRVEKSEGQRMGVAATLDHVAWVPEIT